MSYYVVTKGRNKETLFLVNRNLTKTFWWSSDISVAMVFNKESAAQYSADRLKYRQPEVIDHEEAMNIERKNKHKEALKNISSFSKKDKTQLLKVKKSLNEIKNETM
jgi:hypothetical protein